MKKRKLSLKWFGSQLNLSAGKPPLRVQPSAPVHRGSDPGPVHDGTEAEGAGQRGGEDKPRPPLAGPGYARSSDMYTHVGTVPRSSSKRASSRKGSKHLKKNERQEVRSKSSLENVRESPLLGALQTLTSAPSPLTSSALTSAPSPLTSSALTSAPSPLTSGVLEQVKGPSGAEVLDSSRGKDRRESEDLYVLMVPVYETQDQIQRDRTKLRLGRETTLSELDLTDANGEYVKFSKEKPCLDPCDSEIQDELRLQSVSCYHGPLPPEACDALLSSSGDFLFRDSASGPADLLLSCRCGRSLLHFLVQVHRSEGRGSFSLSGRSFPSLAELTLFHRNMSLSQSREVFLQRPVDRTFPLNHKFNSESTRPNSPTEAEVSRDLPQRTAPDSSDHPSSTNCSSPQSKSPVCSRSNSVSPSPTEHSEANKPLTSGPTSPISSPHHDPNTAQNQNSDQDLDQDSSGYTELYPQSYVDRLSIEEPRPEQLRVKNVSFCPTIETTSRFRPGSYRSALMPKENKPLEVNVLRRVKEILAEVDPKMAAKHMTKADCVVGRIVEVTPEQQRIMGVSSGMELLTLPHGQQLRLDLLERFETMAITLAVHILGCTGSCEERAALIHKLILTASELKNSLGNMFGFCAVMRALQLPQVCRLEQTWAMLRQRHTEGAVLFEKTLRPFMKSLNEGRESCPLSSTSFPHVLPLLCLMERGAPGSGAGPGEAPQLWDSELGVDVLMYHLSAARTVAQLGNVYKSNATSKLTGLEEDADVSELFSTDFQLRLLWGSRGATERQSLRFNKFNQVLTALSNKLEPPATTRTKPGLTQA